MRAVVDPILNKIRRQDLDRRGDTMTGNLTFDGGGIINADKLSVNTAYIGNGEPIGTFFWNPDRETMNLRVTNDVTLQLGEEMWFNAINQTGVDIPNGTVVMFDGSLGASGLIKCKPAIADGTYPSQYIMGITTEPIANGDMGKVTFFGEVRDIDTSGYDVNKVLYIDPAVDGGLTQTVPQAPNLKYAIAVPLNAKNNGSIFVRAIFPLKLSELDDVEISSVVNGDIIRYNITNSRWENSNTLTSHIADTTNPHDTSDANLIVNDITTNNATTLKHGFLSKLSGSNTQYLNGQGNWATISGGSTVPAGYSEITFSGQTSVTVTHNFGVKPLVQVLLSSAVSIPFSITHNTDNDFTVAFTEAESGTIIASAGREVPNVTSVSTNYLVLTNDNIVEATARSITITLPTAVGQTGKTYVIANKSSGNIFITGTGGETIQGHVINVLGKESTVDLYSNNVNWNAK